MAESNRVVVHCADGRLLKGTTIDFNLAQPKFHVSPAGGGPVVEVVTRTLKAVFFVKSLEGRPKSAQDRPGFEAPPSPHSQGKKIAVLFKDGELLCGYTLAYIPGREGFFMFPADPDTNNLRIYVVNAATAEVKAGPEAEALAKRTLGARSSAPVKA